MKKIITILISSLVLSASVLASENTIDQQGMLATSGGFDGPTQNDTLNTVEDVMNADWLVDGNKVTLIGHITMSLGHEQYTFADKTGNMTIKIDDDEWDGQDVTPNDKVKIVGEIEKNDSANAVDVDWIRILNKR
ncbi:NirD/YgiW/YdeI family stress tolerance protein [Vibrio alfacsensis]|uniref:YgiW/YdeI family stress tolerance OB fold protein n=1 Tax=Vibrio alfacsensis TaxID=1074311 RepID=UPI002ADE36DB|nr:NirD/YgiW/YdeI family stress tolerance protein [Vibrio alfacsensis]WQE76382.1 NirD/YgiW/YdeI family stress tolerance protein [Vibrio alfacsensis]